MDFNVVPEYFEVVILFLPNNRFITEDFPTFETPSTTAFTFPSGKTLFIFLITPFIPYLFFALINAIFSGTISSQQTYLLSSRLFQQDVQIPVINLFYLLELLICNPSDNPEFPQ